MILPQDTRQSYYTHEVRSVPDSLFIDAFRHGIRASVDARLPGDYRLHADVGVRSVESEDDETYTYSAAVTKRDLLGMGLRVSVRVFGFSGPYALGTSPSLKLSRGFKGGHSLQASYGSYSYGIDGTDADRLNQWFRVGGQARLPADLYLSADYEYDWGDDTKGHRVLGEVGYRF